MYDSFCHVQVTKCMCLRAVHMPDGTSFAGPISPGKQCKAQQGLSGPDIAKVSPAGSVHVRWQPHVKRRKRRCPRAGHAPSVEAGQPGAGRHVDAPVHGVGNGWLAVDGAKELRAELTTLRQRLQQVREAMASQGRALLQGKRRHMLGSISKGVCGADI